MKLSTNMPSGRNTILKVPKQKPNVSAIADAAFLADLKRTDPVRYKRLIESMQKAYFEMQAGEVELADQLIQIRYCSNQKDGKHKLPDDARMNAKYCDLACKQAAYRNRAA